MGFSVGSKGYVGTGRSSSVLVHNDLWEYDPSTNAWIQKADLPGSARDQAIGFCIGASGFLGTGYGTGNTVINDLWRYTPSSDSWAQVVDFTGGGRAQAIGFSIGPVGYVGTGLTNTISDIVADFWEFDPVQGCSVGSACDDGVPCTIRYRHEQLRMCRNQCARYG
ncbi:MAG: hypothetical protein IPO90_11510 [Flavobacteriales bacterium]|nr:hypothetical protein [Flavobacteriales bacterium]